MATTSYQDHVRRSIPDGPDFFPTHESAVKRLLTVETFEGVTWEPACGDGAISKLMVDAGCNVISSDLFNHGYGVSGLDFLMCERRSDVDNIVTNPPFADRMPEKFADRALFVAEKKVVLFGRLLWLAGKRRGPWFAKTGLTRVWLLGRVPMGPKQGSLYDYAWYVWDKTVPPRGHAEVRWLA